MPHICNEGNDIVEAQTIDLQRDLVCSRGTGRKPTKPGGFSSTYVTISWFPEELDPRAVEAGGHNGKLFSVLLFGRVFPKGPTAMCLAPRQTPCVIENVGLPDMREAAVT